MDGQTCWINIVYTRYHVTWTIILCIFKIQEWACLHESSYEKVFGDHSVKVGGNDVSMASVAGPSRQPLSRSVVGGRQPLSLSVVGGGVGQATTLVLRRVVGAICMLVTTQECNRHSPRYLARAVEVVFLTGWSGIVCACANTPSCLYWTPLHCTIRLFFIYWMTVAVTVNKPDRRRPIVRPSHSQFALRKLITGANRDVCFEQPIAKVLCDTATVVDSELISTYL